jgi:hypothetical protein
MSRPPEPTSHFDPTVVRWVRNGVVIGVVLVLVVGAAIILATEQSMSLLAVVALTALFGGAGFGAMLGGVLASIRAHELEVQDARVRAEPA